ncbi:DUF3192 domain-containing protein [Aliiglaciecola sp. LCG003]|uniref:DUF3192 domain-containing protein n=1 Tax=Aliiglaciecola sp. LCG003 TaxID=3053655 RepID=UPI002572976F|nr:DUF3192 domain-containing protein [Aliiglaciecola sp. LCG003]WJG10421.1 DUF3192 domain-containing protein [Aliiglaciecola sp. LCG003]
MKKSLLAVAFILPIALSGCVISVDGDGDSSYHSDWEKKEQNNRSYIANLTTNSTIKSIRNRMGTPDFSELHQQQDDEIQVLFYRTQRVKGDSVTTKDECTPLVFKNGLLIGWGEAAYNTL